MEPCGTSGVTSASLMSPQCPSYMVRDTSMTTGTPGASGVPLPPTSRAMEYLRLGSSTCTRQFLCREGLQREGKAQEQRTGELGSRGDLGWEVQTWFLSALQVQLLCTNVGLVLF